jgi:hypothetical protein
MGVASLAKKKYYFFAILLRRSVIKLEGVTAPLAAYHSFAGKKNIDFFFATYVKVGKNQTNVSQDGGKITE